MNNRRSASISVKNARKTHCPRGHEYNEANTHVRRASGFRQCRVCDRENQKAKRHAQAA